MKCCIVLEPQQNPQWAFAHFLSRHLIDPPPLPGPLSGIVTATTDVCGSFPSKKTRKHDSY